ncbi:transglycosylase domain-containing protein [Tindallia californiensis]|uniref:Penicillin-binding protein 1A n=1 Tax=Tindallia californiensis TaxID=159292 RepID=A0A1H3L318_9FIRM|nr:PBP1A family penicillin-binding protein [Tindallia californiensis]SDY58619.1 penicillin-binding protein 1A [Tindallia californiensis]
MKSKMPRTEKNMNKRRKWIRFFRRLFLTVVLGMLVLFGAVTGTTIAIVHSIVSDLEPIETENLYHLLDESSFIYYKNGDQWELLEKIATPMYREIIEYQEIPDLVQNAFIAIEDERFWNHPGIDIRRILGAGWTNYQTGSRQGASTINQQLAKNLFLSHEQTYTRKIQDMYYGIQLDQKLSKEKILEAYLNTIYLGAGAYGVQAASQVYFSKDIQELTLGEAALLAGIPRNPSRYAPLRTIRKDTVREDRTVFQEIEEDYVMVLQPEALNRQRLVLAKMREIGWITKEEYHQAIEKDLWEIVNPGNLQQQEEISSYFADLVKQDVLNSLQNWGYSLEEARHFLYAGGLHIYSTLDMGIQQVIEETFDNPEAFPETMRDAEGNLLRDSHGNIQPQSAFVVIEQKSGAIRGISGGRMTTGRNVLNRGLVPRQPGSAIKPLAVYTPAIDRGKTAASMIHDAPVYLDPENPNRPWPRNWYRQGYFGNITVREALQWSSNVATVKLLHETGGSRQGAYDIMFHYLERLGISTLVRRDKPFTGSDGAVYHDETFSTALGGMTHGVSPLEMTAAFSVLANEGIYTEPYTFTHITDRKGTVLVERNPHRERVITAQTAYIMTDMLVHSITYGTGSRAKLDPRNELIPVAGKTGTTSDKKDAWFVGYTPYYSAGLWVGNDRPESLSDGSGMAATLWQQMMMKIHEEREPKAYAVPQDIVTKNICTTTGLLANRHCSGTRQEVFILGTEPDQYCRVHRAPPPPPPPEETDRSEEETDRSEGEADNQVESEHQEE